MRPPSATLGEQLPINTVICSNASELFYRQETGATAKREILYYFDAGPDRGQMAPRREFLLLQANAGASEDVRGPNTLG